jgi:prepilin-type N-terminal cleavage/methylation domain-containing protein
LERPVLSSTPPRPRWGAPSSRSGISGARRAAERGFTLIELTVVVIIISVFSALAMPQVTAQLRDRQVHEAAQRIALIYQQARMRAMGQGGAMLVRYSLAGQGTFETREALVGTVNALQKCALLPSVSCTQTDWANAANNQFRIIESIDFSTEPGLFNAVGHAGVYTSLTTDAGTPAASNSVMDVCFTPLGRTFIRYSATDPWSTPQGVPQISVVRSLGGTAAVGLARKVLILPTGIARLQL